MMQYTVKKLAKMAGVSVRTLHVYDQIGLLKPSIRTEAKYRLYGEKELLRLQQILFYKELDIPLQEIKQILDKPDFDILDALKSHKLALGVRLSRIRAMIDTIDKTMFNLKEGKMLKHEELYGGLPKEQAEVFRKEAIEKWGMDVVEKSEYQLKNMTKADLNLLKDAFMDVNKQLEASKNQEPQSANVQQLVAKHYGFIAQFWGSKPTAEAYKGLGELYVSDERYTLQDGKTNPTFTRFMQEAMAYFADNNLV